MKLIWELYWEWPIHEVPRVNQHDVKLRSGTYKTHSKTEMDEVAETFKKDFGDRLPIKIECKEI